MSEDDIQKPLPWHEGELAMQTQAGVLEKMQAVGQRNVRPFLTDQHRDFYPLLPFVILGSVDDDQRPWATLRCGLPGFLHAPDDTHLDLEIRRETADPAEAGMDDGDAVGLLGIELPTRRRNRMNGIVTRASDRRFTVRVEHAFGNCPKYIQKRHAVFVREPEAVFDEHPQVYDHFDEASRGVIETADTFFVTTFVDRAGIGRQVDVSHRGGKKRFVRIDDDDTLLIPDFQGNNFFNTLGNILMNPKAGLVFADFATGGLLQMTGSAAVIDKTDAIRDFAGAQRAWRFGVEKVVWRPEALPLRASLAEDAWSPSALATGEWTRREPATAMA